MDVQINITNGADKEYVILDFTCGIIEPQELFDYKPLEPVAEGFANKGVIIKGAMPQWLLSYYTHIMHPTRYIAVSVPRVDNNAAVVVATHSKEQQVGNIIQF